MREWRVDDGVGCGGTAAGEEREGKTRVRASEYDERVDRAKRSTFGFGRNARRKTFPAAATCGGLPEMGGERETSGVCVFILRSGVTTASPTPPWCGCGGCGAAVDELMTINGERRQREGMVMIGDGGLNAGGVRGGS
ncbi:hypothetical protein Tco_1549691 [Tanacetum coccineum]